VFLATWSLRSDQERIAQEIERRKNELMIPQTIDEAIKQYKIETKWSSEAFKRSKRIRRRRKD
jgi:hypothetical protein